MSASVCGFVPFPGNGAYGHWTCQRPKRHFGPHRFINYTVPRIPHFWNVRGLRIERRYLRLVKQGGKPRPPHPYRRALYPATYAPIPYRPVSP